MMRHLRSHKSGIRGVLMLLGGGLLLAGLLLLSAALTPTPDLNSFSSRKVSLSTKIYDRTGTTVLYDLSPDKTREVIPLAKIAPNAVQATLAIEDSQFYQHGAISIPSLIRATLANIMSGSYSQGGSTITQQVVKNTILTSNKSLVRKIWEWTLAVKLERAYTKDQILESYLNEIPYGGTLYGIEAASEAFFGKSASELSLAEGAYLAALPQAPTFFSPYGNNREALDKRKDLVLARMRELGFLTEAQYAAAKSEKVVFRGGAHSPIIAPHFVFYVRQYLEDKYGPDVGTKGYKIISTLDSDIDAAAETIAHTYALTNEKNFHAKNTAVVAIDPKTGQILAMVGSRDYFDTDPTINGQYNVALGRRQSGSAIKPFVYAAALAKGFTRQTIIFDEPTQFSTICRPDEVASDTPPCYAPGNFDEKFRGPMTFTTALAQSINIPAVKTLYLAGANNVIALADAVNLGIEDPKQYGLSLALGAGAIRLLDLTNAYSIFPNEGTYHPATPILQVLDAAGAVLEAFSPVDTQVIDSGVARDISSILSDNQARQPEYPAVNPFTFPGFDVAAKTGTTNDSRDFWTIGYTPNIVIGAWAGNNDNSVAVKEIAGYVVAPMWHEIMAKALALRPKEFFGEPRPIPDGAPPALSGVYWGPQGIHDILYWVNKDDPLHGVPSQNDSQFPYWEYSIQHPQF